MSLTSCRAYREAQKSKDNLSKKWYCLNLLRISLAFFVRYALESTILRSAKHNGSVIVKEIKMFIISNPKMLYSLI